MIDLDYLEKRGVSSGANKERFCAEKKDKRVEKLITTIQQRVHDGRESNLREYRTYWAIDLAHETQFAQTTPTLVNSLLSRNLKADDLMKELATYGLSEKTLFLSVDQPNGVTKKIINPPVFFQLFVPLVNAYHTTRTARIYNERDTSPLFKYKPAKQTDKNRVMCDIITDIVDTTAQWYGWTEYLKTAIQQMLKYGICIAFPKEEWHVEEQVIDGKVVVQKEGLRYDMPHPTRMGFDLHHPAPTINSDTGCEYGWHWSVVRYGDILDNRMYWNKKQITFGTNWMDQPLYRNYFNEVYPCQLKFPQVNDPNIHREDKAAYYGTTERDNALFLTEFFWKLKPSQWGLGDYKYPVWHRFTVASDSTILWAAPCAYNPMWFMGYDWDAQAGQPSSFSLECIPWQDHLGNLLSQMILTAKQNLESTTFYERNIINTKDIKEMENLGERRYRSRQFIPYDSLKLRNAGVDVKQAFTSMELPWRSIVELQSMIPVLLNICERVLGITAQESGAAASHYQSKEEIVRTAGSSENRLKYTSSSVDAGRDAWMKQAYDANMAYRDDEVEAHVRSDIKDLNKHLDDLGFKIQGDGPRKKLVGGKKGKLAYAEFVRTNVNTDEPGDPQTSQVIFQVLGVISQKEEFIQAIGVGRILRLLETATRLAGGPSDFDITSMTDESQANPQQFMKQLGPLLQQLEQSIMGQVAEKVAMPAAQKVGEQQQQIDALENAVKSMEKIFQIAQANQNKLTIQAAETKQSMEIEAAQFQAEESRKQQSHEADMQRESEKAAITNQVEAAKASITIQTEEAKATASSGVILHAAQSKVDATQKITDSKVAAAEKISESKVKISEAAARAAVKAAGKTSKAASKKQP